MASANWLKATTQKAGAMKRHLGHQERKKGNHSNKNIDTSLSKLNYTIGCGDYSEALERMKERTKEVDAVQPPKRIRKDRVTCCFIELPCPDVLTQQERSDEFFLKAYQVMQNFFGDSNVHGGFVHKDERHEYTDKDGKKKMSLEHMHTLVSAYTADKGINGKAFETKGRLRAFNKALDVMCVKEFGISLNTGETPERKSVERLKQETELRREANELKEKIAESDYRYNLYVTDEITITERIEALQRELSEAEEKIEVAKEAEVRMYKAEKQAEIAEQRTEVAEYKLQEVNAQHKVANKELQKLLGQKAKAAKIMNLNPFSETVSFHKNMYEALLSIKDSCYDNEKSANDKLQQAIEIQQQAERKEQSIEPLYQQVQIAYQQAEQEKKKQQQLRESVEQQIEERARELADKQIQEMFHGVQTKREKRLENFCEKIRFKDGTSVLDAFKEKERQLKQKHTSYEK